MRIPSSFYAVIASLLLVVGVALAQDDTCEINPADMTSIIDAVCSTVGENQVCYGNLIVNLIPQDNAPAFDFSTPGDMTSLGYVRSLFLSELNPAEDIWGIAAMRLIAISSQGPQDVTLLLFGDVRVDNEVEPEVMIPVTASQPLNIRSFPTTRATVLASVAEGDTLEAIGRLANNSWIRVRVEATNAVGWVSAELVETTDGLEDLAIQEGDTPQFGPMQAMSLTTGDSPACNNFSTDGLLIQTPEGTARVTLLINEVVIELIPSGAIGTTVFIQSNPENGMTIDMIDGSASVTVDGTGYYVDAGSGTQIPLDDTSSPTAPPSVPLPYDSAELVEGIMLLDIVRDPDVVVELVEAITTGDGEATNPDAIVDNTNTGQGDTGTNDTGSSSGSGCGLGGSACDAPGHQSGDECILGGNACDASSRD